MKSKDLTSHTWDKEYQNGRYQQEPPIKFVHKILQTLEKITTSKLAEKTGLYVGCGNGRNYIPLVVSGLNLWAVDISPVAIKQLATKLPNLADRLQCMDFIDFDTAISFDYVISIQTFQHGTEEKIIQYFEKTLQLLRPGGLLFLRVNSVSTDIYFRHIIHQRNSHGGFTIQYKDGPKKGLYIHFYSRKELDVLCKDFDVIIPPFEDVTHRVSPQKGTWSQWELVLQKK